MKKIFLILLFVVVFSMNASAQAFKSGEKIYYNVVQMGLKIGEASLTFVGEVEYQQQKAVLIVFHAKGFNFYDEEKIYLNPSTLKPVAVLRDLNIFGNKEKIEEGYSDGHLKIVKNVGSSQSEQSIDKKGGMDNIYAFIYRYRQEGNFKLSDSFDVHLPTKDIMIKMIKQVPLKIAGEKYNAFYMESNPAKYKIWFDSSDKKLPLRISGAIGVANTVMVMTKYENQ